MRLTIGESRPHKWKLGSFLIMLVEGTDHSHSFITWKDERIGVRKVAEAVGSGGKMITNHEFKSKNKVINLYYYEVDDKSMDEIEAWLWNNMRPYGFKHIFGIFWMRILSATYRLLGINKKASNPFKDGIYSQICTELSARVIEKSEGKKLPGDIEDYGLRDIHMINERMSDGKATPEHLDRVNGIVK